MAEAQKRSASKAGMKDMIDDAGRRYGPLFRRRLAVSASELMFSTLSGYIGGQTSCETPRIGF